MSFVVYRTTTPVTTYVPMTNSSGTAPHVVASRLVVDTQPGDLVVVMGKSEVQVRTTYVTMVASEGIYWSDSVAINYARAMGQNLRSTEQKYVCDDQSGMFLSSGGVLTIEHRIYSASSAYRVGDPYPIIQYVDLHVTVITP